VNIKTGKLLAKYNNENESKQVVSYEYKSETNPKEAICANVHL